MHIKKEGKILKLEYTSEQAKSSDSGGEKQAQGMIITGQVFSKQNENESSNSHKNKQLEDGCLAGFTSETESSTLHYRINVGLRLLIFEPFSQAYAVI